MSDAKALGSSLLVYIEPTPYVLGFVEQLTRAWPDKVDVIFIGEDLSQPWHLHSSVGSRCEILPGARIAAARRLSHRIRVGGYAIVHLAGWGHPLLLLAMVLSRMLGMSVAVETDTPMHMNQSWMKRMAKRILYPALFRIPSVFLPGGTRQKRYLQHYGVPESGISVACMTVDVGAISAHVSAVSPEGRQQLRTAVGLPGDACVFLFVGRVEPTKGIVTLLQAYSELTASRSDTRLLVVGDGSLGHLVRGHESAGVGIRWLGRLEGPALLDAYAAADVFVLPSLLEPWGLVVNEAMAAGLPVIASDRVGCVDDLVVDGRTGIVVEAGKSAALATAMIRLAADVPLRRAMGMAASDHIAGWTLEAEARIVTEAWRGVLRT